jgi:tetrapyrrole methylase family protein / MazG family protein
MSRNIPPQGEEITDLLSIIRTLRGPEGCLWDKKQTNGDIGRYLIEEAYEVIDAIADGEAEHLKEELGDLLFQILFLAVMAEETDQFKLNDIIAAVSAKMIRRHPHVFGNILVKNVEEIRNNWAYIKEHIEKKPVGKHGYLGKYPLSLPALTRAQKMSERAAQVGFDWEKTSDVMDKIQEEMAELHEAVVCGQPEQIEEEIGDMLFSLVNLCRFVRVDAEQSLRKTMVKFEKRFTFIENTLANQHKTLLETSPEEMNRLWDEAKTKEKVGEQK